MISSFFFKISLLLGLALGSFLIIPFFQFIKNQLRQEDGAGGLISGMKVSDSVVEIVKNLRTR